MAKTILTEPNPILRQRSKEVDPAAIKGAEIKAAIRDLKETLLKSSDGIGIAAPQVGIPLRIFIVSEEAKFIDDEKDTPKKKWEQFVYINPVIVNFSRKKNEAVEGCLSVPKRYGFVARPEKVEIEAYDENGEKFLQGASKFYARVLQHELDHLDGILFVDKVKRFIQLPESDSRL